MNLLVTGACGFIGSNFIHMILNNKREHIDKVINLDCLTYAGNESNTIEFREDEKYFFEKINLCDLEKLNIVFKKYKITHVVHFAAESHVDNSISNPSSFIQSNIVGTFNLLDLSLKYNVKRFHHVSTDEVYGDLGDDGLFSELSSYNPKNPYSASKASSDFLVRSYFNTYKLPVTISNCSNNYGPRQHNEKFIPTVIKCLLDNKKVPIYGNGKNIRDWIYVDDHCSAVWEILIKGKLGETYCIGSMCEKSNIEIVKHICKILNKSYESNIEFVNDRPGHDFRYAINNKKIIDEIGWNHAVEFNDGIRRTVEWYAKKL